MTNDSSEIERVTIILHSESYDRVTNALSLAIISLAMGMEVHMMITYQAIRRFVKGHLEDMDETDPEFQKMFQKGIGNGGIRSVTTKLDEAKKMGLNLYVCVNALTNMNHTKGDLVDEVD